MKIYSTLVFNAENIASLQSRVICPTLFLFQSNPEAGEIFSKEKLSPKMSFFRIARG